jgi:hypothetical protein
MEVERFDNQSTRERIGQRVRGNVHYVDQDLPGLANQARPARSSIFDDKCEGIG